MPSPNLASALRDRATLRPRQKLDASSLRGCPSGDGSAVLVLPGILHGDGQTAALRDCLQMLGYTPLGWGLGLNHGPSVPTMDRLGARISQLAARHGRLRLVGFSMGGLFARWAAQSRSASIAQVITICSPFRDPLNGAWLPMRPFLPLWPGLDVRGLCFMIQQPPEQPWAALYSRQDGIVRWQNCMDSRHAERCFDIGVRHSVAMQETATFRQLALCLAA